MNIVLLEPEIPQNTGNIGRTCLLTKTTLHLIEPLGFDVDDKTLKRAGLDYWPLLSVKYYKNWQDFEEQNKGGRFFFATTKTTKNYSDIAFMKDDFIVFGRESKGLPESLLESHKDTCIRIPMIDMGRSLNLSNAVNIVLYEALRQCGFDGLL